MRITPQLISVLKVIGNMGTLQELFYNSRCDVILKLGYLHPLVKSKKKTIVLVCMISSRKNRMKIKMKGNA